MIFAGRPVPSAVRRPATDAELDAALGRQLGVALGHAVLHLDGAAYSVNDAAELDDKAVAGALHHAAVMHGNRWVN
jgi:hypothetical protein